MRYSSLCLYRMKVNGWWIVATVNFAHMWPCPLSPLQTLSLLWTVSLWNHIRGNTADIRKVSSGKPNCSSATFRISFAVLPRVRREEDYVFFTQTSKELQQAVYVSLALLSCLQRCCQHLQNSLMCTYVCFICKNKTRDIAAYGVSPTSELGYGTENKTAAHGEKSQL